MSQELVIGSAKHFRDVFYHQGVRYFQADLSKSEKGNVKSTNDNKNALSIVPDIDWETTHDQDGNREENKCQDQMDPQQLSARIQIGKSGVLKAGDISEQGALEVYRQDHADW